MTTAQPASQPIATTADYDVVIIGAGISGIGAAHYLRTNHPEKSFAILESRDAIGGTWDLFRYPGIRSDSDLFTFGYEFKPWTDDQSIADAPRILDYLREAVADDNLEDTIVFHRRVTAVDWSDADQLWHLTVARTDKTDRKKPDTITAHWIFSGTGYYNYDEGYTPQFPGQDDFQGQIVHPQHWPEDLDYKGKQVVIIGSGATAVTLMPAMAPDTAHITMLQRTPSYIMPVPREDPIAKKTRKLLGEERGFKVNRQRSILQQKAIYQFCQRFPGAARKLIRKVNEKQLPEGFDVDKHFNPPYDPWDQRLCAVPNGDMYKEIRNGDASVVTANIKTFDATGIQLDDGTHLDADIIITATGLNLQLFGGMAVSVNGEPLDFPSTVAYRGAMLSGLPNFIMAIGYTNSSWTLKIGLLCEWFCRVLSHMDKAGYSSVRPVAPKNMETRPLLDFEAGYVKRSIDTLPKQGTQDPWKTTMSVSNDIKNLRKGAVDDGFLRYDKAPALAPA
ncbi:MAG TPA: NAD(P)/FAD-dependent oxidoreductase [Gordonia sp. (in: high G+C Gram-positive bacteria)]|uniref:flavin-containing monooxygenase n=1 Tax=unclassified Gordonia (in: high G+C Gram-positive bacteria) TaxID=2657482 RepID=UPI000FBA90A0|nr:MULTISPECIES: NAD(P)/FAD-dependent oxidoreductase [unclassified Gordonia (in: high G+C Gram-positive bacteria)]RUP35328.1 MAG: NAD(P)/FAD-dependent oxidoreductase [Gordonia sp. (in: high G+C Gram-positive bacteria)]HNP55473.1 NAD(P)/FAD-dependent oxidoreductase [Gordonia sp. (in: high G+C Gram-positive bacteria)]HRC50110.1 NAD(P)/FAD-dependent oxidoreductase [Gordonia sp. (in: high G+C Gram-positive bacteria)]